MRKVVLAFCIAVLSSVAYADEGGKALLESMAQTIKNSNFTASFVVVKGHNVDPYHWRHGTFEGQEIESLSRLNGAGLEIFRKGNVVTYFEPQSKPYSLKSETISGPFPSVLFSNINELEPHYHFALGGKSRISGRLAQLVRIEAKNSQKFNYWLWIDGESSLPLKTAYVDSKGQVMEQLQLTNVSFSEQPNAELIEFAKLSLPAPLGENKQNGEQVGNWKVSWLPTGFKLINAERKSLTLNNELADSFLFSDGLVDVSVFVQRPLAELKRSNGFERGATAYFIHQQDGFEVSVIGNIPKLSAKQIAESVSRAN
jgi:sigma-E factor negative regulatory protein RseB